jgi:alcohol dehydrogenase class IV
MGPFALEYNFPINAHRQQLISLAYGQPDVPAYQLADATIRGLGMPRRLRDVGIKENDLQALAGYTFKDIWCGTNPRPIPNPEALTELLRKAL